MKRSVLVVAILFLLYPATLVTYRVAVLGYPLFPTAPGDSWRIIFSAHLGKGPTRHGQVGAGLPFSQPGITVLREEFTSGTMNFGLSRQGRNRIGFWTGPLVDQGEIIGYNSSLIVRPIEKKPRSPVKLRPYPDAIGAAEKELVERLTANWKKIPVTTRRQRVAGTIRGEWGGAAPTAEDLRAWDALLNKEGPTVALLALFRAAEIHARAVEGLRLVESILNEPTRLIEVWSGKRWLRLNPQTGDTLRLPGTFLPLTIGNIPALEAKEGLLENVRWRVEHLTLSNWRLHFERILRSDDFLDRWSFFHLPDEFQETFRILLLVPLGALLIGILRNIVGFPTFGVFMPVLMALAFRNTGVWYGLGIFGTVMILGYFIRMALDNMHLLLVPRLSVMLSLVISCLVIFAVVGNKIGLREFMAVGLMPFVILTMVIERFFVMIEESGVKTATKTALGSAAVAVISFSILNFEELQLTFFIYPELIIGVAGLQLLLGRYTGYRLSELIRFKAFRSQS